MDFRKLFGIPERKENDTSQLGKLFAGINSLFSNAGEEEIKRITSFAGLLGKVAYADMDISDVEISRIRKVLQSQLNLESHDIDNIISLLGNHRAELYSIEDFIYLRIMDSLLDKPEKLSLLRTLFTVAAADDSVSAEEDAVLWSIAKGLKLSHREFISIRREFKNQLDVLKKN